ncbi:Cytochrome B561 [gamma proteobacterium HdN1]|nr:Cytochrome B561 [gamma proteobacterium HdN1]
MSNLWRNSPNSYGLVAIGVHWLSAVLVIFLLATGIYMVTLSYYDTLYHTLPQWHKLAGVAIALLTLVRLLSLLVNRSPALIPAPAWQLLAAHAAHHSLRVLLVVMVVTGYIITTAEGQGIVLWGEVSIPALATFDADAVDATGFIHRWCGYAIGAIALGHAGAALFHHFIARDATLVRMLRPGG